MPEPEGKSKAGKLRRALRWLGWTAAVLGAVYAFLLIRFVTGFATPRVDYLEELNRPKLEVAVGQRGWTAYREALLALGGRKHSSYEADRLTKFLESSPGTEQWGTVGPWLAEHANVVELIRLGAARRRLGFVLGWSGSINDPQVWPGQFMGPRSGSLQDAPLVGIVLPHLSDLKMLAHVMALDARFARSRGEGARVMADIETILKLSQQLRDEEPVVVSQLVATGMWNLALEAAEDAVVDEKLALSDHQLRSLAQLIAGPNVAADVLSLAGERLFVLDVLQRCYSDNGNGDGYLTMEGQRFLAAVGRDGPWGRPGTVSRDLFTAALTPALSAGRKDVVDRFGHIMDAAEANLRCPRREANWTEYEQEAAKDAGIIARARRPVEIVMANSFASAQEKVERKLGHRDGILVGIALELYRRKHAQWPGDLQSLTPEFLHEVPRDRISGDPLKYRIIDGRPEVYSVGCDGDDDGGMRTKGNENIEGGGAAQWGGIKLDGDWVVFGARNKSGT